MSDALTPLRRARLVVAYDGAGFHGFAENDGVPTVMGTLRAALERVVRRPLELVGAGRTDAGVHAWGQVVSGDLPATTDLEALVRRANRMCGPRISVRSAAWADDPDFNARFSARWRHYRYLVVNDEHPNPFLAAVAWHVPQALDTPAMQLACDPLIGEHDFSSFCRRPKPMPDQASQPSMTRRVRFARWTDAGSEYGPGVLQLEIRANAFCHQMVRSIVGTLVDVGLGKIRAGDVRGILVARDRAAAGQVAPPHGLCLWEVGYDT
jgi:tRNA pseudouridine38-40 synthase